MPAGLVRQQDARGIVVHGADASGASGASGANANGANGYLFFLVYLPNVLFF